MNKVTLYSAPVEGGLDICFGLSQFQVKTDAERALLESLPICRAWLYFPSHIGKELLARGIESTIYVKSGNVYVNGEIHMG